MATTADAITTLQFYPERSASPRYFALWDCKGLLIIWNILGHLFLGFEQSHIQPLVGLATAISLQFLLEWVDARATNRKPRFAGSSADLIEFLRLSSSRAWLSRCPISQREADAGDLRRRRRHVLEGEFPHRWVTDTAHLQSVKPWNCRHAASISLDRSGPPLSLH